MTERGFYTTQRRFTSPVKHRRDVVPFGKPGPIELPTAREVEIAGEGPLGNVRTLVSPVFLSTAAESGRVQLGLGGLPLNAGLRKSMHEGSFGTNDGSISQKKKNKGTGMHANSAPQGSDAPPTQPHRPVVFVGNHQLLAADMYLLVEEFLRERGTMPRGLAHPAVFLAEQAATGGQQDVGGKGVWVVVWLWCIGWL